MSENKLIGRKYEQKLLREYYDSPKSELVALYGRSRIVMLSKTLCYSGHTKPFTDKDGTEWSGARIDMLIDRKDQTINILSMKYSLDEFVITGEYERKLRNRISLSRHATKTKKALLLTFITTYGVKKNIHSSIVNNEIKMDDLFRLE